MGQNSEYSLTAVASYRSTRTNLVHLTPSRSVHKKQTSCQFLYPSSRCPSPFYCCRDCLFQPRACHHGVCPWKSKMRRRNKVSRGYLSLLRRCLRSELSPPLLLRPSRWSLSSRRSLPPPRSSRLLCSRSLSLPDSSSRLLEEICVITGQRFQISMNSPSSLLITVFPVTAFSLLPVLPPLLLVLLRLGRPDDRALS